MHIPWKVCYNSHMYYCLVHYPEINTTALDLFKRKYDPYYPGVNPHISLIFPVPASEMSREVMVEHVKTVLKSWKPFDYHLAGFEKAVDHWLFLTVKEGNEEIIRLHDQLYSGPFKKYLREDLPFLPHVALGLFTKEGSEYNLENPSVVEFDEAKYKKALEEAERSGFDYHAKLDKVNLLTVEKDLQTVIADREIVIP